MSERFHGIDWPRNGGDPFDATLDWAGRFYWAHERPSRVFEHEPSREELYAAIPMGYTALSMMERLALYDDGSLSRTWIEDAGPVLSSPLQPYQLLLPPDARGRFQRLGASWPVRFALRDGESLSARTGGPVLVCRALSHEGWH